MTGDLPVFVNQHPLSVPAGTTAAGAAALADPAWGEALAAGRAYLTDARGLRLDPGSPLHAGAIVRVVVSTRGREESGRGDA